MTVSDRKTTTECQSQTGLTSDHDLSHEDLCDQRKVIEDINKDIQNISLKLLSQSEESDKQRKDISDNDCTTNDHSIGSETNEAVNQKANAQPIDSTIKSVKLNKTALDCSGDHLSATQKKVNNQTKDMNHVTQNDKVGQQLRHNDIQQNDEEMMDTAVDSDTIRTDGLQMDVVFILMFVLLYRYNHISEHRWC